MDGLIEYELYPSNMILEQTPMMHLGLMHSIQKHKIEKNHARIKNVNDLHSEIDHPNEATIRATGANTEIKVMDNFNPLKAWVMGETMCSNVNRMK